MGAKQQLVVFLFNLWWCAIANTVELPNFQQLRASYPGYKHHGGQFRNHHLIQVIGCRSDKLLHDTSALRLSYALNKIGGVHSLGKSLIRLSKFGEDSVVGKDRLQYIYHPIAYGPFLADKYGYPSVSKLHEMDPVHTKKNFWGKQGILRVITYTQHSNLPVGHVALWDCNRFFQSKDWISMHSLITVEFWESPDSNCSGALEPPTITVNHHKHHRDNQSHHPPHHVMKTPQISSQSATRVSSQSAARVSSQSESRTKTAPQLKNPSSVLHLNSKHTQDQKTEHLLHNPSYRRKFLKKYFLSNGHLRHAKHRGLVLKEREKLK